MRVYSPVTDYIRRSLISTVGDLVVRGASIPERLAVGADGTFFMGTGTGNKPAYEVLGGTLKEYLKAAGAAVNPAFSALRLDDVGVHIGSNTRNSAGAQVITGVGYKASVFIFLTVVEGDGQTAASIGFDNGTTKMCIYHKHASAWWRYTANNSLASESGVQDYLYGYITAIGADGFTITWTRGDSAYTIRFIWLALP